MHALENREFDNYWFRSGTPTFLVEILRKEYKKFDPDRLEATKTVLQDAFDVDTIPLISLMFQAGYLTIKEYDRVRAVYMLAYPNSEVQQALQVYLLVAFSQLEYTTAHYLATQLTHNIQHYEIEELVMTLRQLFAHVPYHLHMKEEKFYHALLQMACTAAGLKAQSEYSTSHGRIDLVIYTEIYLYIIEIKFNQPAAAALAQIEERRYYERFLHEGKKIILLGLAFKREPHNFDIDYALKEL